jgi:hypothetical protein
MMAVKQTLLHPQQPIPPQLLKYAKVLHDFGMKVASITLLCQKKEVFMAMAEANTFCPHQGKIGEDAKNLWEIYPKLRPDYEEWKKRSEYKAKIDLENMVTNDPFNHIIIPNRHN